MSLIISSIKNQSPSPSPAEDIVPDHLNASSASFLPYVPFNYAVDLLTLTLIFLLLLFSLFSLFLIFHIRIISYGSQNHRLQSFAFHSPPRFLLVIFVSLWAITELIHLPLFHYKLNPFFSIPYETNICKLRIILSLGIFEPAFLISILFLMNTSIKPDNPIDDKSHCNLFQGFRGLTIIFIYSCPIFIALYLILYRLPTDMPIPDFFYRSIAFLYVHTGGAKKVMVLCTYPLFGVFAFGIFGVIYSITFVCLCWRVISLAINRWLRLRINVLSFAVLVCMGVQLLLLSFLVLFTSWEAVYYSINFLMFMSVLVCAAVGEGFLVTIPIIDALSVAVRGQDDDDEEETIDHDV